MVVVPLEWAPFVIILIIACYAWEYYSRASEKKSREVQQRQYQRIKRFPQKRVPSHEQVQAALQHAKHGAKSFQNGEYHEAKKAFELAAKNNWSNVRYRLLVAAAISRINDLETARLYLEEIVRNRRAKGAVWREFGVFYFRISLYDIAQMCLERATYLSPREPTYLIDLAKTLRRQNMFKKAIERIESKLTISVFKNSPLVLEELAHLYMLVDRLDDAEVTIRDALALSPHNPNLHVVLGDVLIRKGEFDEAEHASSESLSIAPNDSEVFVRLGFARLQNQEPESLQLAKECFETALKLTPDHTIAQRGLRLSEDMITSGISAEKVTEAILQEVMKIEAEEDLAEYENRTFMLNVDDVLGDGESYHFHQRFFWRR